MALLREDEQKNATLYTSLAMTTKNTPFYFTTSQQTYNDTENCCGCKQRPAILVVDDAIFNIVALQTILEMTYNLKSDKALNGQLAIDKIKEREELRSKEPCTC